VLGLVHNKPTPRIAAYCAVSALVLLTASAFAYDTSRNDRVADGISVAGVDVGGLGRADAESKLRTQLVRRLERPVRVLVAGHRFRLTQERAGLVVDVGAMVQDAIDRGRSSALPVRVWREVTRGRVDADLPADVSFSGLEVKRFARRVARGVDRPARNASVKFKTASLPAVPSRKGLRVSRRSLLLSVEAALALPGPGRTVRGHVKVIQPKVTTGELAKKYPYVITVDRPNFKLRLFKRLRLKQTYPIAVGRIGLETPAGLYHIQDKVVNPSWHVPKSAWAGDLAGRVIPPGPDDPLKARWMGIFDGAGIHGTDDIGSLGSAASHGCIRMSIPDVEELYDKVSLGTPVFVQ
jgi:L,D-transpeptidase catalytic domain/Putative peptidoglycan binding domain